MLEDHTKSLSKSRKFTMNLQCITGPSAKPSRNSRPGLLVPRGSCDRSMLLHVAIFTVISQRSLEVGLGAESALGRCEENHLADTHSIRLNEFASQQSELRLKKTAGVHHSGDKHQIGKPKLERSERRLLPQGPRCGRDRRRWFR